MRPASRVSRDEPRQKCRNALSTERAATIAASSSAREREQSRTDLVLDTLDLVLHLHVKVAETLDVLVGGFPVPAAVRLEEVGNHLAERVGVGLHQALLHLRVFHVHVIRVLVHPVVHLPGGGGPAQGVVQALLDLARALVAGREHALVPLGIEQTWCASQDAPSRTASARAFAVVVSAMNEEGILPSL